MKKRILAVLLAISVSTLAAAAQNAAAPAASPDVSSLAPPAHPASEAQIREYLALTHALDIAGKAMVELIHSQRALSPPFLTPGFWDDMEKAVAHIDLVPLVVPAYQKYLSEEDMGSLIAFYKTPAGQRILASQPFIQSAISDAGRKAGEQAGLEVSKKHAAEIERLMKEPQQKTPAIQVPGLSK